MSSVSVKRTGAIVLVVVVVLSTVFAGVATARSGVGGTTVVESDETISNISGAYGTVVIEGTVTGDVSGVAGDIVIREGGVVEGDLDAAAGSIRIAGTVRGDVSGGAGSIHLAETGVVEGKFNVGAGEVRIDGRIEGNATVGADTIRLGENATVAGSLTYDGSLEGNRDAVQGEITEDSSLGPSVFNDIQPFAEFVFALSMLALNFVLGVLLLLLFPNFSAGVADRVSTDPIRSGLIGLGLFIAVPILLIAIAITVIGIPIALAGVLGFLLLVWVGIVYGRFAVGYWLLSYADIDNPWAGLALGLVLGAILGQIPIFGTIVNFAILVVGLGALVTTLYIRRRRIEPGEDAPSISALDE